MAEMKRDPLQQFTDDAVRALAWSIGAPGLMRPSPGLPCMPQAYFEDALEEAWEWLLTLDQDPSSLHAHLSSHATWKVGFYFEALIRFWLMWKPGFRLLEHNLQIQGEGRTLGALDYLLIDRDGRSHHWEVAVKFYLQRRPSDAWSAWVGPNRRDRLDIKLSRMRDHQLPLSGRPAARSLLEAHGILEPPETAAIVKGMFFTPWDRQGARCGRRLAELLAHLILAN